VEDTPVTSDDIKREFGERVAKLVLSDSEDKMEHISAVDSWQVRKQATIDALTNASKDEQIVCIADKLANLREIAQDYAKDGDAMFLRFNQKDKSKHAWYYGQIHKKLTALENTYAYREYARLIDEVFGN
jgi:myo-inositol-1(or 4)-monophosphatase